MNARLLAASLAAIVASGVMSAPAFPQSIVSPPVPAVDVRSQLTRRFVASAMPAIDFLNDSSRLALDRSASPRIRSFADREAREQTIIGNSMIAWADVNAPVVTGRSAYVDPDTGRFPPIAGLVTIPLDFAGNIVSGTPGARPTLKTDLTRLGASSGRDFDALYVATQIDRLQQLATLYRDYSRDGDDAGLRVLAARELPRVEARLRALLTL